MKAGWPAACFHVAHARQFDHFSRGRRSIRSSGTLLQGSRTAPLSYEHVRVGAAASQGRMLNYLVARQESAHGLKDWGVSVQVAKRWIDA